MPDPTLMLQMLDLILLPTAILLAAWMVRGGMQSLGSTLWRQRQQEKISDFQRSMRELSRKAERTLPAEAVLAVGGRGWSPERLATLAADCPRGAVLEGWQMVEEAAREAAEHCPKPAETGDSGTIRTGDLLLLANLLTPGQYEVFNSLRQLRNTALNLEDLDGCLQEVRDYLRLASLLAWHLAGAGARQAARNKTGSPAAAVQTAAGAG